MHIAGEVRTINFQQKEKAPISAPQVFSVIILFFLACQDVLFQGCHHAGRLRLRSFNVKSKSCLLHCPHCIAAKSAYYCSVLFKLGQIVKKTLYAAGSKETNDIIFFAGQYFFHIVAEGAVHKTQHKFAVVCLQPVADFVVLLVFGAHIQKFFVALVLIDYFKKAFVCTVGAVENFSFPVQNKFLKVKSHCFGDAEILGILRYIHFQFFAGAEEMVNSVAAGKDDTSVILDFNFLAAEFFSRNRFKSNEGVEFKFEIILS